MEKLIHAQECYRIIGACLEVYQDKGCGFLEAVYQECLEMEFALQSLPFRPQEPLELHYKGQRLREDYLADFVCFDKIIVEVTAVPLVTDGHRAELRNALSATGYRLGVLVNFGHFPKLEWERLVQ